MFEIIILAFLNLGPLIILRSIFALFIYSSITKYINIYIELEMIKCSRRFSGTDLTTIVLSLSHTEIIKLYLIIFK